MTRPVLRRALALLVLAALGMARPAAAQLSEADVFVAEGIVALEDKKYEEALGHFRRALEREADHVEALYYSGVALMAMNRPAEALPLLEHALAKAPAETSITFQLGLAYFAAERYERAERLLEELFEREPSLDSLGYYVGFLRYRRRDYQGALRAFRTGRTTDANVAQLTRFYTGLALAAMGLTAQGAAEVERALRLQPASPLTGPAERLRDTLVTSHQTGRRLRLSARAGISFDDNVATQPDRHGDDETVGLLREGPNRSWAEILGLRAEYDIWRQGPWEATVGYSFFATINNDLPRFNLVDHLGFASLSRRDDVSGMPLIVTAQYSYEYLLLDETEFLQRHSVLATTTLIESSRHLTNAQARVEVKDFVTPSGVDAEVQDAVNWMVGVLHMVRFAEDRHYVRVGYQLDIENAEGSNYRYHGHRFLAGAQYTLPWRSIRLIYDFTLHYRDYTKKHTIFPLEDPDTLERSDIEFTNVARVEVPLGHNFTLGFDYQRTDNQSNFEALTYTRNVYTLALSWQY